MSGTSTGTVMVDKEDFDRLEDKVDQMANALGKLILIDERQMNQGQRIGSVEQAVASNYQSLRTHIDKNFETQLMRIGLVDKKVDTWINRGIGVWAAISSLLFIWQLFGHSLLGK